jgi:hypothetical protein
MTNDSNRRKFMQLLLIAASLLIIGYLVEYFWTSPAPAVSREEWSGTKEGVETIRKEF